MSQEVKLSPNDLAFIALTNEYCHLLENISQNGKDTFVTSLLKLLPRIYITATDLSMDFAFSDYEIDPYLTEENYDFLRNQVAAVMGQDDVYLEVFLEDMKYSDTPIATTVSENLADLYQEFFNFVASVKDRPTTEQQELIGLCKDNFKNYWGQTLCNVLRALHNCSYSISDDDTDMSFIN